MRDERFGQHERSDVVRRERIVPAQRVLRSAHREDARIVELPDNREMERDDLRSRGRTIPRSNKSHTTDIGAHLFAR
jgi:hypothetical protein